MVVNLRKKLKVQVFWNSNSKNGNEGRPVSNTKTIILCNKNENIFTSNKNENVFTSLPQTTSSGFTGWQAGRTGKCVNCLRSIICQLLHSQLSFIGLFIA